MASVLDQLAAAQARASQLQAEANARSTSTSAQEAVYERAFAEQKRQADRDYSLRKRELDQQYKIAKENARTARERNQIERWYNQEQVRLAGERLAEDRRQFDARLQYDRERAAEQLGLSQAKLGYDVLNMQANLRGPSNYYQAAELARGVAAQPGTATFLNALRDNARLAPYVAPAGLPERETVNTLAARLGGPAIMPGTGTPATASTTNDDANLAAIRGLAQQGAHKLGAGALEQLTETERKLLQSGLDYLGVDTPQFLEQYARSRIGNSGNYRAA